MNPTALRDAIRHCEACYPAEGCGVVLAGPEGSEVVPIRNTAGPHAFTFDPTDYLAVLARADRDARRLACVFHSHTDRPAFLSDSDARDLGAAADLQLIISVCDGKARSAKLFRWVEATWHEDALSLSSA